MRRIVGGWALGAFLASFALLVARTAAPGRRALELDIYLIVLAAVAGHLINGRNSLHFR